MRRAASTSAGAGVAGRTGSRLRLMPIRGPAASAQRAHGLAVGEQQVVGGPHGGGRVLDAGGVDAGGVPQERRAPRLVQGRPVAHPVAQRLVDDGGVLHEAAHHLAAGPAAGVLERLREVPVVQRDPRLDAALQQAVDQPRVEVEALGVGRAAALRLDAGPGDREPVGAKAQVGHERGVLAVAVVVVGGHVAGVAAGDPAGHAAEGVPDGGAAAALASGALHLVGGGGGAPDEAGGEQRVGGHRVAYPGV